MVFIETSVFTRLLAGVMADSEYACLQQMMADRPDAGSPLEGGGGIRKIRWASSGHGKRGGVRIVYCWRRAKDQIYMLYLFSKSAKSDLTPAQLTQLAVLAR